MGSRGQNPLKQMFMGSVSTYVSSHAPCPVIVIHETEEERRQKKEGTGMTQGAWCRTCAHVLRPATTASLEEKKMQKKTSAERKAAKKKQKKESKKVQKTEVQQITPVAPVPVAETKMAEPHIVPPVTEVGRQGPIIPTETTIPVMEK